MEHNNPQELYEPLFEYPPNLAAIRQAIIDLREQSIHDESETGDDGIAELDTIQS